jgi:hypothetical protein
MVKTLCLGEDLPKEQNEPEKENKNSNDAHRSDIANKRRFCQLFYKVLELLPKKTEHRCSA